MSSRDKATTNTADRDDETLYVCDSIISFSFVVSGKLIETRKTRIHVEWFEKKRKRSKRKQKAVRS